jgi:PAS domain-containing protein
MELIDTLKMKSQMLESIPEFLVLIRPDLTVEWVSKKACRILGKTLAELTGQKCHMVMGIGGNVPCEDCPVAHVIETQQEYEAILTQGDDHYWYVHAGPIVNEVIGGIVGVAVLRRDIKDDTVSTGR